MGSTQESPRGSGCSRLQKILASATRSGVRSDAMAALGICCRQCLGKARHLDVADLWAQDKVRTEVIELVKVLGADNPADIMAKYTDRQILEKMPAKMNMHALPGRAAYAPAAAGCQ